MCTKLTVTPLNNVFLPPFTSKVTRTAFTVLTGVEPRLGRRRASFSVLFRDGKPLYRTLRSKGKNRGGAGDKGFMQARKGERLEARYSLLVEEPQPPPSPTARFSLGGAEFMAVVEQIEVCEVEEAGIEVPDRFMLRFLTPTLLPVPGRGKLLQETGVKRRYRLVPDLPLALMLAAHDLRKQGLNLLRNTPARIFGWSYRALAEMDYRAKPVTALYTYREGKPAVERGFTGWVSYELLDRDGRYLRDLGLLLGFALRFGLGKSRSIGFGHVELIPFHS